MSQSQITTNNEKEFIDLLFQLQGIKLIYGIVDGNGIDASHEIRWMPTPGGMKFALAEFDYMNRRASGIYSDDPAEAYIRAIDIEKTSRKSGWWIVKDCEHVPSTEYRDAVDHLPPQSPRK